MKYCPKCFSAYAGRTQFCDIDGERLVESEQDPLLGRQIGRYTVKEIIGRGSMGCVYRAVHDELKSEFAVKVLIGDLGADEMTVGRFKREAQAASQIRSNHVAAVVDFGTTPAGLSYLVMEHVPGRPLDEIILNEGPLAPPRVARLALGIATGLAAAHKLGFVHRDVKPSNVLVSVQGRREIPKLVDFGIVRNHTDREATQLTRDGKVLGTPAYMAPEQWQESAVGPSADLYALGIVICEMLTGHKPFRAQEIPQILTKHLHEPPPPLPPAGGLEYLAHALMAKRIEDRPQSARIVVEELEHIQAAMSGSMSSESMSAIRPGSRVSSLAYGTVPPEMAPLQTVHGGSMAELTPPRRRSASIMVLGLILLGTGLGAFALLTLSRDTDLVVVEGVPPRGTVADAEKRLQVELASLGMSPEQLEADPGGAAALGRFRKAVAREEGEEAEKAFRGVIEIAEDLRLSPDLLRHRLEQADPLVGRLADALGPEKRAELEERYYKHFRLISRAEDRSELKVVARGIDRFLEELREEAGRLEPKP